MKNATGYPAVAIPVPISQFPSRITIQVPVHLAGPASRTAAVTRLAAAAGGQASRNARPGPTRGWIRADGQIAGHHARIFTAITQDTP
jgi:hypothetical protein